MSTVDIDKEEMRRLWSMQEDLGYSSFDQFAEDVAKLLTAQKAALKAELLAKIKEAAWTDGMETVAENEWKLTKSVRLDEITKIVESL